MTYTTDLAALEQIIASTRELAAEHDHRAIAAALTEAAQLCATARTVQTATNLQLQGALAAIRAQSPTEAAHLIERALDIQARWSGNA
jgi:hypothetical protein